MHNYHSCLTYCYCSGHTILCQASHTMLYHVPQRMSQVNMTDVMCSPSLAHTCSTHLRPVPPAAPRSPGGPFTPFKAHAPAHKHPHHQLHLSAPRGKTSLASTAMNASSSSNTGMVTIGEKTHNAPVIVVDFVAQHAPSGRPWCSMAIRRI